MFNTTPKQAEKIHRLVRDKCCNCVDDNCVLLDNGGDDCTCVQLIAVYGVYCKYFRDNVLPADEKLYAQIAEQSKRNTKE